MQSLGGTKSGVFLVRAKKLEESQFVLDVAWLDADSGAVEVESHLITRTQTQGYTINEQSTDRHMELESLIAALMRPRNRLLRGQLTEHVPAPLTAPTTAKAKDLQSGC